MTCNQTFNDILDGTTAFSELTREELIRLWGCIDQNQQRLLLVLSSFQAVVAAGGGGGGGGEATITSGTTNTILAGANSVIVVKTNSGGSTDLAGQSLTVENASLAMEAPPAKTLPEITITPTGGSTHAWTAIT